MGIARPSLSVCEQFVSVCTLQYWRIFGIADLNLYLHLVIVSMLLTCVHIVISTTASGGSSNLARRCVLNREKYVITVSTHTVQLYSLSRRRHCAVARRGSRVERMQSIDYWQVAGVATSD